MKISHRIIPTLLLMLLLAAETMFGAPGEAFNPTPPISHGAYYEGVLAPGFDITFDGSGSYDTDIDDLGYTPKWRWDFDYNGSFSTDVITASSLVTHQYSQAGSYTVAVRYVDNDNQTGQTYTFQINVTQKRRYYYLKDHLGSIRTTVDEDGIVQGYDDYYPFGLVMPGRSSNTGNPNDNYKYTGHELDDEAGLDIYHMNARAMDPVLGRFMQIDPHHESYPEWSPYAYAFNNPVNFTDPTGMDPCEKTDFWCQLNELAAFIFSSSSEVNLKIGVGVFSEEAQKEQPKERQMVADAIVQDLKDQGEAVERVYEGLGVIPGVDVAQELYEGDYGEAALDAASLIPIGRGLSITGKVLKKLDPIIVKKITNAAAKGTVGSTGQQGIKAVSNTEALSKSGYTHKIKILGKGGDTRVYGKKQADGSIVFDKIVKGHK